MLSQPNVSLCNAPRDRFTEGGNQRAFEEIGGHRAVNHRKAEGPAQLPRERRAIEWLWTADIESLAGKISAA